MTPLLRLAEVSVSRHAARVVTDVSLSVRQGAWFGLIGANGSGKTTLLRAVAGRLPFASGSCLLDGAETVSDRPYRATQIGFCPPAETLPDILTGREVLKLLAGSEDTLWRCLGPLRTALQLDTLLDRRIGDCSAGMRQRIALATAFARGQRLVILDEPFNWLDPVAIFDVRETLRSMVDEGLTLITALHDLTTLATNCDTGLLLANGRTALTLDEQALKTARHDLLDFERRTIALLRS
ncbi:ATP-binding cassette domain-containing protein [Acetobacter orleanensis]|nr:ABC transporter ATP-binding protein [Acetobacter orleanensis]KXV65879.1 ABC transporter [Acetobacter orleanensis]PCD79779.1 ABC transporter ATP-binding protein [Acetobacter orleanensis]